LRISIPVPATMPPVTVTPIRTPVIHIPGRPPIVSWCVISRTVIIPWIIPWSVIIGGNAHGDVDAGG
jgi:hypothetical protein